MKATKIMMKSSNSSNSLLEIDSIYIDELCRLIKKEKLYDKIEYENWKVNVDIGPYYPKVEGVISSSGEKYVKSVPNDSNVDNLLCLPKVEI